MQIYNGRECQHLEHCPIPTPPAPCPCVGPRGPRGPMGPMGFPGPQGPAGTTEIAEYGNFYALAPTDNPTAIAPGSAVDFPNSSANTPGVTSNGTGDVVITEPGIYFVQYKVDTTSVGQLQLTLNDIPLAYTTAGNTNNNASISNTAIVPVTTANSTLRVINPTADTLNITVTPNLGGTVPTASQLTVMKIA